MHLLEILQDETSVNTLAGRAAKSITKFVQMICHWQQLNNQTASEIVQGVMAGLWLHSGFAKQGTDEAQNRLENIQE